MKTLHPMINVSCRVINKIPEITITPTQPTEHPEGSANDIQEFLEEYKHFDALITEAWEGPGHVTDTYRLSAK